MTSYSHFGGGKKEVTKKFTKNLVYIINYIIFAANL